MSMERIWEARSLCSIVLCLLVQRKELRTPMRSSLFSFLWLLWMLTRYSMRDLFSSSIPSIRSSAKVTSFASPRTFFTISKNSLMYRFQFSIRYLSLDS